MIPVIIADDHAFIRAGVEAVLRGSRFAIVATATNGSEALEAIARHDPAIVILDLRMPVLDGLGVLQRLRETGDQRPVVLLTAELDDRRLLDAMRANVNGIVLKDGAEERLLACLDAVLAGRKSIEPDLLQKAMDLTMQGMPRGPLDGLTPREKSIALLVAQGRRNREIADELAMTEGTVKVYLHGIFQKLGIDNRTELAVIALQDEEARP